MEEGKKDVDKGKQRLHYIITILLTIGIVLFALFMPSIAGVAILVAVLAVAAFLHRQKSKSKKEAM
jgi:hypothetical protein